MPRVCTIVKFRAIENIYKAGMKVSLQVTVINGVNNDGVGEIVDFAARNSDKIFGVIFQPMMFAGRDENVDPETRHQRRYTASQLATDLKMQASVSWEPLRDWFPIASCSLFATLADMLRPESERGAVFANGHPDSQVCSPLLVDQKTGSWFPFGSFLNLEQFFNDLSLIIDSARSAKVSQVMLALAVLRNFRADDAPSGFGLSDLKALYEQCVLRTTSQTEAWTAKLYSHRRWTIMFVDESWFQDLYAYELHNVQMSTINVADAGINPDRYAAAEVGFSFKNAGGWREIVEYARHVPVVHDRKQAIFSGGRVVPVEQLFANGLKPIAVEGQTIDEQSILEVSM